MTFWQNMRTSKNGARLSLPWVQLAERVGGPIQRMEPGVTPEQRKQTLPMWHAATFRDNRRGLDALDLVQGLWLDFDSDPDAEGPKRGNPDLSYDDVRRAFGDVRHLAYTTCRHRPGASRLKVLLPLSRPVTLEEYAQLCTVAFARAEAAGAHGLDADATWREPSRAHFVPCTHAHYEGHATPEEVPPLDVEAWLLEADHLAAEAEAATWDEVRELAPTCCAHRFPVEALPPVVRAVVHSCAEAFQVPTTLPATLALAVLAATVSGKYRVQPRTDWREHLTLWACVVLRPGTRKSPVFAVLTEPLKRHQRILREKAGAAAAEVRRERARLKAEQRMSNGADRVACGVALEELRDPPTPSVYIGGDTTPECIPNVLADNGGRLLLADDEAALLQHAAGLYREGGANIDALLKGWDGAEVTVHRKGAPPLCIPRALLSVALTVQPQVLQRTRGDTALSGRGFLARFLWAIPPDGVGNRNVNPPDLSVPAMTAWGSCVEGLLARPVPREPEALTLSDAAAGRFLAYLQQREHMRREGEPLATTDAIREWASKADGAVLRIAGVLHLAACEGTVIADATLADAIAIVDHYTAHARLALATLDPDPRTHLAARVVAWLRREPARRTLTRREAHHQLGGCLKAPEVAATLEVLEERGYLRQVVTESTPSRAGRPPSPTYEVNPRWRRE
jgi:hypothetical protein